MIEIPKVLLNVLPGGRMPERQTDGAIGYDVYARAVVSAHTMDPKNPNLRQTLFDFTNLPPNPDVARHVSKKDFNDGNGKEPIYIMDPGESVLVGIGFITAMSFPMFYWVAPRSGLASKWGITVTNAPGTVDPDYRGEAGVLVYNRNETTFDLRRGMRIAQIIFQWALMPEIAIVNSPEDLPTTSRGSGGFGSTGLQ
ncbi:MAG: dUTP pyrophosphatase [Parcubacteria group bacterium Gr01-1014_20]|nr:MAG: dUTP pyrophosphatase [Parcubacteria group bacterium Gr01-1014_20]